jgi:glycerol uptake facilitator protein
MGTLVLILLGNGTVANVVLKKTLGHNAGWLAVTTGFATAVMLGVFTAIAFGSSDAHINPAVTLGVAILDGDFSKFVPYAIAQTLGAMAGALLVWLHFLPHWPETDNAALKLACFSTGLAIRNTRANILGEVTGTLVLVVGIVSIVSAQPAPGLVPFLVGATVWCIGLGLGGTTGFAINPARDLGPRIVHAILPIAGKADSDWGYAVVPIVGPLIGGALAGALLRAAL